MAYYDIKRIYFKLHRGGATTTSSYGGSFGFKRPQSEYEAKKMAEEWILKQYPGATILDLRIEFY